MFLFEIMILKIFFVFSIFGLLVWYFYYSYCFSYWRKRGVPTFAPRFPAGNITKSILGKENVFVTVQKWYMEAKRRGHRHVGLYFFNGPVYLPVDPEIVKSILTTDFEYFTDRGMFIDEEKCPLSNHLFSIEGQKWKNLRNKLLPTFSSAKLKSMFEVISEHTENFVETVNAIAEKGEEINVKYVATNFTVDVVSATALGIESRTLQNPKNEISQITFGIFYPRIWEFFKCILTEGFQNPGNIIKVTCNDMKIENFFKQLVTKIIAHRENNTVRKDFMSFLLEIRKKEGLSFEDITAQTFLFYLASFETSSQTIAFCIHSLAYNQHLQDKLRNEIFTKIGKDFRKYTYEDVLKLPYLDQVFNETLRIYPALAFLNRICVKPYKVPGTDVVIEKGTPVLISTLGLQRDPDYFPDPLKFDPERFDPNQSQVPFTFLPFGEGPRICIGKRFGTLQTKLGVVALISQFRFFPSPKTPHIVKYDKILTSLASSPIKGITVKVQKL